MHQKLKYNKGIDGLRAIAILLVLFYHADFSFVSGGFIGVDIFFVLSGYLITHHICDELFEKKSFSFAQFYARRIKRLLPAILFLVFSLIILWGVFCSGVPWDTELFVNSVRYSVFGLANIFFQRNTGNYFDTASDHQPLLHFWSLAVEEQFYLVWPLLLFLIYRYLKFENIFKVLCAVIIFSFLGTLYLMSEKHSGAFYWMPARAWELACGGILVFLIPKIKTMNTHFWSGVSFTSLAVISFCAILFDKSTSFPGVTALPAVLATMALVASLTKNSLGFNKIFENKFFLRIGLLSFGLYLWHWPLFTILKINGLHHSVWNYLGLMLISYGMSEVSLKFVENPIRFGDSFKSIKPRYVILAGLSFCYLVMNLSKTLPYVDSKKQTASNEFLAQMKEDHAFKKNCHDKLENLGLDLCHKNYGDEGVLHLFLWGNSHAAPFAGFFDDLAKHHKFKISYGSAGHYASFLHPEKLMFSGDLAEKSLQTHRKMFELIQKEKGEKIVVLSNRLLRHFKDAPEVTKESIDYTINLLIKEKVSSIIMTLPSVEFPLEPKICLMRKMDCTVDKKEVEASRKEVVEFLKEMERKYSQIYLIDPLPFLCPGSHCQLELNGFPINQDDDHMSVVAGRYLYGELKQMKSFQDILKNKAK